MISTEHLLYPFLSTRQKPVVMGIVNVTPDSFSDGDIFFSSEKILTQAFRHMEMGADFIDVGGESTRPGALPVCEKTELERVLPVIERIRKAYPEPISIDTRKAEVALQAIQAGASIVNDVSALQYDSVIPAQAGIQMIDVLKAHPQVCIILMHMAGTPETMQSNPVYKDVVAEVYGFLQERIEYCIANGISANRILVDPGIGFGKTLEHNLALLANLAEFHRLGVPIVLGASRKRFIDAIHGSPPNMRLGGSLAATQAALEAGVEIVRVHDVWEHKQYIRIYKAIESSR